MDQMLLEVQEGEEGERGYEEEGGAGGGARWGEAGGQYSDRRKYL